MKGNRVTYRESLDELEASREPQLEIDVNENCEITRVLSILEPFAWASVASVKAIENRTWVPRDDQGQPYRGRIAIHASGSLKMLQSDEAIDYLLDADPLDRIESVMNDERIGGGRHLLHPGYILGSVEIVDTIVLPGKSATVGEIREAIESSVEENGIPQPAGLATSIPEANWAQTKVLLVLRDPRRYRRVFKAYGKLNLWRLSSVQQRQITEAERDLIDVDDPGCPAERID